MLFWTEDLHPSIFGNSLMFPLTISFSPFSVFVSGTHMSWMLDLLVQVCNFKISLFFVFPLFFVLLLEWYLLQLYSCFEFLTFMLSWLGMKPTCMVYFLELPVLQVLTFLSFFFFKYILFLCHGCNQFTSNRFLFVFWHFSAVPHIVFVPSKSLFLLILVTGFPSGAIPPCLLITELSICILRVDARMLIGHLCDKEVVVISL